MYRKYVRNFLEICLEKSKLFSEIIWKNRNFSEICLEKSKLFWPGSTTPPDFKPVWRRCTIQPSRSTRSSSAQTLLHPSVTSSLKFADRSIAIAVPPLWNKLPPASRQNLTHPTNSPKSQLLLPLHSSFTPNWKHCPLANPILIHRLPHISLPVSTSSTIHHNNNFNNFRVSNIRVSNRTLIYNVCPEAAITWPSRHSRHRHLCRFYRSLN